MLAVELGLDVGSHVDVVDNETLEGATEVDVAPIAVHALQAADLAIANLKAGKIAPRPACTAATCATSKVSERVTRPKPVPTPARRCAFGLAAPIARFERLAVREPVDGGVTWRCLVHVTRTPAVPGTGLPRSPPGQQRCGGPALGNLPVGDRYVVV